MIIGLDIDDVIFNTSEYLGGILEDLQDNELNKASKLWLKTISYTTK
ncbi:hypothetical protein IKF04_03835 [Candidatus Saccharibacteria bacterium]|nr:hypothetical protein [Candidatus Saccharibacteria bacterium]